MRRSVSKGFLLPAAVAMHLALSGCGLFDSSADRLARADAALAAGNPQAALVDFKAVMDREPKSELAATGLARAQIALGQLAEAEETLARLEREGASASTLQPARIDLLFAKQDWQGVLKEIARPDTSGARDSRTDIAEVMALLRLNRPKDAEAAAIRIEQRTPGLVDITTLRGLAIFQSGDRERALAYLATARGQLPDPRISAMEADLLRTAGRLDEAEKAYKRALERAASPLPKAAQTGLYRSLIGVELDAGRLKDASDTLAAARAQLGDQPGFAIAEATIALVRGDARNAEKVIDGVLKANPQSVDAICISGNVLVAQSRPSEAESRLQDCLRRDPLREGARRLLANLQASQGKSDQAAATIAPIAAADPYDLNVLAINASRSGDSAQTGVVRALQAALSEVPKTPAARLAAARSYLALGKPTDALELLRAERNWPPELELDRLRATALGAAAAGNDPLLDESLQKLISMIKNKAEMAIFASRLLVARGRWADARAIVKTARASAPDNPALLEESAVLALKAGDRDGARASINDAVARGGRSLRLSLMEAELAAVDGQPRRAADVLTKAIEQMATVPPQLRMQVARYRIAAGDKAGAEAELARLRSSGFASDGLQALEAEMAILEGKAAGTIPALEAAVAARPTDGEALQRLVAAKLATRDGVGALRSLDAAKDVAISRTQTAFLYGELLIASRRNGDARRVIDSLARKPGTGPVAERLTAILEMSEGKPGAAAARFEKLMKQNPDPAVAMQWYAALRASAPALAARSLEESWKLLPGSEPVALELANVTASTNRAAAQKYLEAAKATGGPLHGAILNNLAWMYFESGDSRALATAQQAAEQLPEDPRVLDTLGWIMVNSGDLKGGASILRKARSLPPEDPAILEHLADAEKRLGNASAAANALEVANHLRKSGARP